VDQILIDSGDGPFTNVVYDFCRLSGRNTNPSKGFRFVKDDRKRAARGDEAGPQFFRKWKPVRLDSGQVLYTVSTNFYKTALYNNLRVQSTLENPNPPGLARFPFSYSDEFFLMLTGEEKRSDGAFHPIRRRVEALDCRTLAMAASDIFLDRMVMDYRMQAQRAGASPETIQSIDSAFVIGRLEEQAGIAPVNQQGGRP
jgi:phage terminase large subunit GpA-like protein